MKGSHRFLLAAAALGALVSSTANARPLEAELPRKEKACFERVYDEAHLAANPKQKVTRVRLLHMAGEWLESEKDRFYLQLQVNLRKRPAGDEDGYDYSLGAFCQKARGKADALDCANEWDAGSWRIERAKGGLMVRNNGLIMNPDNYDAEDVADDAVKVPAQPDDRAWMLTPAPASSCKL